MKRIKERGEENGTRPFFGGVSTPLTRARTFPIFIYDLRAREKLDGKSFAASAGSRMRNASTGRASTFSTDGEEVGAYKEDFLVRGGAMRAGSKLTGSRMPITAASSGGTHSRGISVCLEDRRSFSLRKKINEGENEGERRV